MKPTQPILPEATAIHHITDLDVAQAPSFDMIYDQLKALLEGKRVVIYNAGFDIQMLRQSGVNSKLPALTIKKTCCMEMYAQFIDDWSDYFHGYRWQPLPGGDHTARGDCLVTLDLIKMMASTPLSSESVTLEK